MRRTREKDVAKPRLDGKPKYGSNMLKNTQKGSKVLHHAQNKGSFLYSRLRANTVLDNVRLLAARTEGKRIRLSPNVKQSDPEALAKSLSSKKYESVDQEVGFYLATRCQSSFHSVVCDELIIMVVTFLRLLSFRSLNCLSSCQQQVTVCSKAWKRPRFTLLYVHALDFLKGLINSRLLDDTSSNFQMYCELQ